MDIFKRGDKVWFEYEISGHSYERCGFILDGPFNNGFYRIKTASGAVDFYVHKDKIYYERPDKRINELEEAYSKAKAMCDNSEPERVCKTCKNRECGLAYEPCAICKDHIMWEPTIKVNPFKLGDLVRLKYASKPAVFIVVEIKHERNAPDHHYLYDKYSYSLRDKNDPSHRIDADHDELEKVDKQYTGGYIYPVGAHIRYEYKKQIKYGTVIHHCKFYDESKEEWYYIREDGKSSSDKCDRILGCDILGYAVKWDDPTIRKAFGLDVNKNDIYENIKKQINKDQLNFHYGLSSIFKLAPNDAAVPFELSEKEKEYIRNDVASTMSYLYDLHKNGFYGTCTDTKIVFNDIKEDNMKNNKLIRSNGTYKKEIKKVIFSGPVTTIVFEDEIDIQYGRVIKSKTNVRCQDGDEFNKTTGYLLALLKTFVDKQSYDNILRTIDGFEEDKLRKDSKFKLNQRVTTRTGCGIYTITDMTYIRGKDEWLYECVNGDFKRSFWESQLIPSKH